MKGTVCAFFLVFFFFGSSLNAQENRQWFNTTYEALESEISSLKLSQRFRWRSQDFQLWISEIDYKTDLTKRFSGGLELRYQIERDRDGGIQGNRASGRVRLNLYHEIKLGSFDIENRAGIQYKQRFDDGAEELIIRFRPQITPQIKNFKYDPTFRIEYLKNIKKSFDYSIRYGFKIPIKWERNRFEIGYFYEQFKLQSQPNRNVIFLNHRLGR
jgi:hypothetical protein